MQQLQGKQSWEQLTAIAWKSPCYSREFRQKNISLLWLVMFQLWKGTMQAYKCFYHSEPVPPVGLFCNDRPP